MKSKKVLISGASIAGPALAFWLNKYGFNTTIVERAPFLRPGGQNIDVKGAAQKIVNKMGLEELIRAANTGEIGVQFVDEHNKVKAALPKGESTIGTSELEILRGDLAKIFYEATRDKTEYIFGNYITKLEESDDSITAALSGGDKKDFDLVIAADGVRSATREIVFGNIPTIKFLGLYTSYLTIPKIVTDNNWARWYNAPGSRSMMIRPDNEGTARASLSFLSEQKGYERLSLPEQKEVLKSKFAGAGWEAERLLNELEKSKDVYFDGISQVIAPNWSKGRFAMVGDAAFCPSPLTGMGTSLSIVGAYVLAGELASNDDHHKAFAAYEKLMRPFVEDIQKLPPGVPWIAHPKTSVGINLLNLGLRLFSRKAVKKIASLFEGNGTEKEKIDLPDYDLKTNGH